MILETPTKNEPPFARPILLAIPCTVPEQTLFLGNSLFGVCSDKKGTKVPKKRHSNLELETRS